VQNVSHIQSFLSKSALVVLCGIPDKSLLQNIVSFVGLFCKRDMQFEGAYDVDTPQYGIPDKTTRAATMKWLRLVGSSKSWVCFAKYRLCGQSRPSRVLWCTTQPLLRNRRLLKITGLFCKRALQKRRYSAKETHDFEEPINRSHTMVAYTRQHR